MSLTAKDVAEILRVLEESSFDTLELEIDGMRLQLRRGEGSAGGAVRAARPAAAAGAGGARTDAAATRVTSAGAGGANVPAEAPPGTLAVPAPLLGVFYRAPKPGEPPFIEVGSRVTADSIVGIIEVMKLMNTVRAGATGVVREIRARDGMLVEYGETLLLVETREPG